MESRKYYLNQETNKIELRDLSKDEYQALSDELKSQIKSSFLFSGKIGAWVSRSTNNHYSAIRTAEKLGFTEKEVIGERLSFAEQIERQVEKAEARIEKYEQYADNAGKRVENLQNAYNEARKDWSFVTQPNINSASGRAFTNYRNRIIDRYEKGFEEYRKSEYFTSKARTAEETANMEKFKDKVYLNNRIKECSSNIKKFEASITHFEDIIYKKENNIEIITTFYKEKSIEQIQEYLQNTLEKMEYELDKLAYLQNCLDEIGGIQYSKENLKAGYLILIRHGWAEVIKANTKTVDCKYLEHPLNGWVSKVEYAEIKGMKIPEGYIEPKNTIENPYKENDILVCYSASGKWITRAYQVLKVTAKGVQIQRINLDNNNKPILNGFTQDKPMRKQVTKSKYSDFIGVYDDDWQLHKYNEVA